MIIGGYSLDLYCDTDNPAHRSHRQAGEIDVLSIGAATKTAAIALARKAGWTVNIHKDEARCPLCRDYPAKTAPKTDGVGELQSPE
jgi:hypothetical protein